MDFKARALASLRTQRAQKRSLQAVVGLDGFVDTIVKPVGQRSGQGDAFTPIKTIPEFAQRILGAAGKSTNIEFYPLMDKLGGNGPIMANALHAGGTAITYIGALGAPAVHPVFADFAEKTRVVSLCNPAATTAVEFGDGKLMLGQMKSLDEITLPAITAALGADGLRDTLAAAAAIALVNWTMIPNMTAIFTGLLGEVLPTLPARADGGRRLFFFDLADPEKRSREDLREVLGVIGKFTAFGDVTLGLNLKEAQQVSAALDLGDFTNDETGLRALSAAIREKLALTTVVVHPRESAACATAAGTAWVPGPYCDCPLITTGAGDHFNAGFTNGQLLGLDPEGCLALGVCTSGHYVRTAASPTLDDLETFLANWN